MKSISRKTIIMPDGTRIKRIVQRIKHDNTISHPTNVRGQVYVKGKLVKVIPMDSYIEYPMSAAEWKVIMKKQITNLQNGDMISTLNGWRTVKKTQYWRDNAGVDVHTNEGDIIGYASEFIEVVCIERKTLDNDRKIV